MEEYTVDAEVVRLRDGSTVLDRRLDRLPEFDEKSRDFPILATIDNTTPRSYTWKCETWNNQGREGACVGFSWSHELAARPIPIVTDNAYATRIYKRAQQLDQWEGEAYSGSSVLGGAKAVQELLAQDGKGIMPEYRWAFGVDDLMVAVSRKGPAVLGINWYKGMSETDDDGFIHVTGAQTGGHAIVTHGFRMVKIDSRKPASLENIDWDKSYFLLRNSWGIEWGWNGDCKLSVRDMNTLLEARGEAVIPVLRKAS